MDSPECARTSESRPESRIAASPLPSGFALWNTREIDEAGARAPDHLAILEWLRNSIVKPNEDLGRSGPVCPFVAPSLQLQCLWVSVVGKEISDFREITEIIAEYLQCYFSHQIGVGTESGLRTLVIAFPRLSPASAAGLIERAHFSLKPSIVELGLMLGEFCRDSMSRGIHNPRFFPLRSPMPLFVLRQMVPGDLVFLNKAEDPPERRNRFLRAYLKSMKGLISAERVSEVEALLDMPDRQVRLSTAAQ